jgi:hypothetical protein
MPRRASPSSRSRWASSIVGAMHAERCSDTVISERSRPRRSQCSARTSSLRGTWLEAAMMFDSSAYWATIRNVLRSPPPPIINGMRDTGGGELKASTTW